MPVDLHASLSIKIAEKPYVIRSLDPKALNYESFEDKGDAKNDSVRKGGPSKPSTTSSPKSQTLNPKHSKPEALNPKPVGAETLKPTLPASIRLL